MRKVRAAILAASTMVGTACTKPPDYAAPPPPAVPGQTDFGVPHPSVGLGPSAPSTAVPPQKPIAHEPDPAFPESQKLKQMLVAYSIGVRDEEWAGPTERTLWKHAEEVRARTGGRVRWKLAYCLTRYCVVGRLEYGTAPGRPRVAWCGSRGSALGLLRSDGWGESVDVLLRHVRDYPAFHPRVHSSDPRSAYPACRAGMENSCKCACFPYVRDLDRARCPEAYLTNQPRPICSCAGRFGDFCGVPLDSQGNPQPFPAPPGEQTQDVGPEDAGK